MVKRDIIAAAAVLLIAAALYFGIKIFSGGDSVTVISDGRIYGEYPLDTDAVIDVNGTNTVVIENGEVYISQATCPDKLCMHQGKISDSSRSIVCLPNRVTVSVGKKSEVDAVSGGGM